MWELGCGEDQDCQRGGDAEGESWEEEEGGDDVAQVVEAHDCGLWGRTMYGGGGCPGVEFRGCEVDEAEMKLDMGSLLVGEARKIWCSTMNIREKTHFNFYSMIHNQQTEVSFILDFRISGHRLLHKYRENCTSI